MADSKIKLKGHGSFVVREGWLSKAMDYVEKDNTIFREKRAADAFGVGNNMGQAIRFWLKATGLMSESTARGAQLTELGKKIHKHDPYLEDVFSIWLLHCNIVMNKELATSWYLFYNSCDIDELTKEEIYVQMKRELDVLTNGGEYSEKSLMDDVTAICNMYSKVKEDNYDPEDNNISPFSVLGLVQNKKQKYSKTQPNFKTLNEKIVMYCLIKQMNNQRDISIDDLVNKENSVCKVLNLKRVVLNQYLDRLEEMGQIRINRTSGLDMVYRINNDTGLDIVENYYKNLID